MITYSSCSSMPLSSRHDDELLHNPVVFCVVVNDLWTPQPPAVDGSAGKPNSRSACSGNGVGVSNTNVSTIEPLDDPNETLWERENGKKINGNHQLTLIQYD